MTLTHKTRRILLHAVALADLTVQLAMTALGVFVVFAPELPATIRSLASWCALGTVYLVVVALVVTRSARRPADGASPIASVVYAGWAGRFAGALSTVLASLTGIVAAVEVRVTTGAAEEPYADAIGIWAMLLSWALLHWGYAQFYHRRECRADEPAIRFPGTENPRLSDFVYFAYTVGTTFAASDTKVLSAGLRWAVAKHSILSFFYNGAIIVLALNTLTAHS